MTIELLDADLVVSISAHLPVFAKYNFAFASTWLCRVLSECFDDWDTELAEYISASLDRDHVTKTCRMVRYPKDQFDYSQTAWNTTTTPFAPQMIFQYHQGGCYVFEHGLITNANLFYRRVPIRDPGVSSAHAGKEFCYAIPILSGGDVRELQTLKHLPVTSVSWTVHSGKREPGVLLRYEIVEDDTVIFVGTDVVVSARVTTVNPRVTLELMGTAVVPQDYFLKGPQFRTVCAHINLRQLRLYVSKAIATAG